MIKLVGMTGSFNFIIFSIFVLVFVLSFGKGTFFELKKIIKKDTQFNVEFLFKTCSLHNPSITEIFLFVFLIFSFFFVNLTKTYLVKYFDVLNPMTYDLFRTILVFLFNMFYYDLYLDKTVMTKRIYWVDTCLKVSWFHGFLIPSCFAFFYLGLGISWSMNGTRLDFVNLIGIMGNFLIRWIWILNTFRSTKSSNFSWKSTFFWGL